MLESLSFAAASFTLRRSDSMGMLLLVASLCISSIRPGISNILIKEMYGGVTFAIFNTQFDQNGLALMIPHQSIKVAGARRRGQ